MTPPPLRLIHLHLSSRRTPATLVLLAAIAVVLRAGQAVTKGTDLVAQTVLMLVTVAAAAVIAASTRTPFGEPERTASSPLPLLRLTHLAVLGTTATSCVAVAASTATYGMTGPAILRDLAGLTGMALLTAAFLGAHLAWTAPLGYVMYCGARLDEQVSDLWTWPTRPEADHAATAIACSLLVAGITAVTLAGARDRHADPS